MGMAKSPKVVDRWTPLHVLAGYGMGRRGWAPSSALLTAMGFQMLEKEVLSKTIVARKKSTGMAADIAFVMGGYFAGRRSDETD
jgi:hypothetical protein